MYNILAVMYACACMIWHFYDQTCGKEDWPQTMMTTTDNDTVDNSWLLRLIGIYAKWANKQRNEVTVMFISKHVVHVEKVQNVNFFKNL